MVAKKEIKKYREYVGTAYYAVRRRGTGCYPVPTKTCVAGNDGCSGQAMVELAVFGGIILVVFGVLLSFLQQFNNQQYVAMETFRRGLERACNYVPEGVTGSGASVQYTLMQTRRQADMSGPFRKGSPTTINASASLFWAVPEVGTNPESVIVMRVNEDEKPAKPSDFTSKEDESFRTEEAQTSYVNTFGETTGKRETSGGITNTKTSKMNETLITTIPYVITKKETPDDYDDTNDVVVKKGTFLEFTQGAYVDEDGQYKYSEDKADTQIERSRTWETAL